MSRNPPPLYPCPVRSAELGKEITELFAYITAATYELLVKIREFDQAGHWKDDGVCSCAHWLNWRCGLGMNAGREKVRVANALDKLPKISDAFRRGEISYSKVRAMTRVAVPESEDYLLMIARHGTAHHVETLIRGYRRATRLNDESVADRQQRTRSLNYRWDDDGSLVITGRLPAEVGAMLVKALQADIDHQEVDIDVTAVTRDPIEVRRADALANMAESYLEQGPAASSTADRYQVMVHVSAETLAEADVTAVTRDAEICHIEDGPYVTAETSRRLCCDTSISRLMEDKNGEPLSIGRKSRVIPAAMRRALKARDRNCRFPGCTHRYFIDGHHIKHWADGGETSLDNLVQLCRFHHRLVHEGGFRCEKDRGNTPVFRNVQGERLDATCQLPKLRENAVLGMKAQLEDLHIDAETCVTQWDGERMDRHLAVGHLCDLQRLN